MPLIVFQPSKVVIGLDPETLKLGNRIMDYLEGKQQAKINSLTDRLAKARGKLAGVVFANPDPNLED